MENIEDRITAFVEAQARAAQAQEAIDNLEKCDHPDMGTEREDLYVDSLFVRSRSTIAELIGLPAPTPDALWDKIRWLKRFTDDEAQDGEYLDGRVQKLAASIAADYERLHLVASN
jgi:hypothetical protein